MKPISILTAMTLIGCAAPSLVPVPEPDSGVDAGSSIDGGARERLVKLVYAYQVELGEDAAWSAFVDTHAPGVDPAGVQLQYAVYAFGTEGGALAVPFGSRAALSAAGRRQQPLRVIDEPGAPGTPGPQQIKLAFGAVAELVAADARSLSHADQARLEYRVIFVTSSNSFGASCDVIVCSLLCCVRDVVDATRGMRGFLELWDSDRVTTQPVRVTESLEDPIDTYLLELVARGGGTRLITTTRASLPATLAAIDLLRAP